MADFIARDAYCSPCGRPSLRVSSDPESAKEAEGDAITAERRSEEQKQYSTPRPEGDYFWFCGYRLPMTWYDRQYELNDAALQLLDTRRANGQP